MAARKTTKWIYWLMMGLLLLGLGGWFTGGGRARATSIGSVDGLDIRAQDYANTLRNQMQNIGEQTGQALTMEQATAMGLDRAVLSQVVSQRVLDAEAQRLGLSVGDLRVAQAVQSTPAFQGLNGEFDRQVYREALRRNGLDEGRFETSLREDTTRTILQAAVVGGMPEPTTYAGILAAYSNETRGVTWATVGPEAVANRPEPTSEDLRGYYEAHPDEFTAPELREISYAWLTPEMIQDELPVDDAAVQELYDSRLDEFVQEERRLVERLVFPDDQQAQAARSRLDSGEATFETLVEERGLLLSDTDLGDVAQAELDEAGEAVFAAQTGDIVGPLPSALGPAMYRVNAVLAADETTFEEAAPDLRIEIANDRARDLIADLRPQVEDLIAGGASIEDLDSQTDLQSGTIKWTEAASDGPAAYQEFRQAAQAAQEGDFPEIVDLADGGLFVLRLDGVTPPELRPFDDVAPEVRTAWEREALNEAVAALAQSKADAIAGGASFEEQGLAPRSEPALNRRGAVEGTPPDFVETAFAMAEGEARVIPAEDGAVVMRLDTVQPAADDAPAVVAEQAAIASQVSGSISQDVFAAFSQQLQTGAEIRINDQAVAAVNAQLN
ncbi:peptidylprolyl isomerase [Rubellimicrobium rubrum]|uniref:Peptidylprolyl isomerase n=1 Tax=Rubellimicrobium rubrum TaxID=2585369 RepID=A0A5C4MMU9_9RHOB|nr:peptidyl-prolyl cis-trans isomerase [Rubellimicrobium rubrum]TNC45970.1 peptidylprolyl isomerase [Rubellimicrobium rubrum]